MARTKTCFRCGECGGESAKWAGRCPSCEAWNTLVEEAVVSPQTMARIGGGATALVTDTPVPIDQVDLDEARPRSTGVAEADRVLGGGLVPGSVTLLGGEPGVGKSTLLLQILTSLAGRGLRCLYISAEESKAQVRMRAERLGTLRPRLLLACETAVPAIEAHVAEHLPDVLVVDSIQTVFHPDFGSAPGTVAQVRECASVLVRQAKQGNVSTILVGHVTKDGGLAGPRVLEHLVDTVLSFQGDRHHALRMLRADKHRFGSTDELGLFEMTETGLVAVPDPSVVFLADRRPGVAGSAVAAVVDGHRPLLVEVQALVSATSAPATRISSQGLDGGRMPLLVAVLREHTGLGMGHGDVYLLAIGGSRVVDPGADLAVALAVASAATGQGLPPDLVACGEVGLGGEVRQAGQIERRMAEAARLGFSRAIVPWLSPDPPPGLRAVRVRTVDEALGAAGIGGASRP